ncbi:chemotaxis protein CheA [Aliarcobacter cryaerophilus]|uniref:Chemotaxis protein CheA n=1 Tax=Aliarcobacter cryaerophilus TaxID=28198 RepID=A0A2S9SUK4_9BACT|nr:chemotaxis protein CheA [Aliarcobacter cryaerophilus]PRM90274.1 chemotaxis protein CheA [Aliarcobacter cryaerophilus]
MSFDISKYREMFLEEAAELFESADNVLLAAENNGSLTDDEMGQLFRDVHTLKGSGASVELAFFAEFTHDVENLMDKLRSHKIDYKPEMAETLIDGLDVMKEILELEVSNQITREKFQDLTTSLLEELRAYSNGSIIAKTVELKQEPIPQAVTTSEKTNTQVSDEKEQFGFFNDDLNNQRDMKDMPFGIFEDDDIDDKNIGFYDDELENLSNNIDDNKFKIDENKENFGFFDDMEKISPNSIMETNDIESETSNDNKIVIQDKKEVASAPTTTRRVKENSDDGEKKSISNNNNSIRVNLDKIDLLMNNVGDLVITNAMLTQFSSTIEETKTRGSVLERLELLERHIRDMQDSIMSIRMVPMDSIYSKFPKVVRDISKKLGKKVEFKHYGDNVEIDKAMIEGLTDPLMHIIRNSLDHGIEMPEDRVKSGKIDTGTISISAEQANGQMIITIKDDGKGVDSERVAEKALEKGQIDENQFASMSHNDKALLIFGAGLSTADQITDISGRGVGMDVVKTNIHKLGGIIKLDTELGKGTIITIMLPLTLAIFDGLDIRVGDQKYILPLSSIVESLQPTANMIKKIGDGTQDLLMLREEFIPVVKLHQLFGLKKSFEKLEDGMLIVVKSGNTKVALSIDEFLNQHQVVVKPLDKNFRSVQGIGAATVRGDGSIGLILDVLGIIDAQIKIEKDMNATKRAS